ncbi:MAG: hypothetical protein PHY16_18800 [Methylobacter sp.]|nr:hypothetical protein [Methylobacter sp.]
MKKLPYTTLRSKVEIRGVYGQPVFDFYQQFCRILDQENPERSLSQFFAEPQLNALKGEIQWYTNSEGTVKPYSQLESTSKTEVLDKISNILQGTREIGGRFAAEGGSESTRTEIFKATLSATDLEKCLFLVGEQPVLCEWGCKSIVEGVSSVDLWSHGAIIINSHIEESVLQEIQEYPEIQTPKKVEESQNTERHQIIDESQINEEPKKNKGPYQLSDAVKINLHQQINKKTGRNNSTYATNYSTHQVGSDGFDLWVVFKKVIIGLLLLMLLLLLLYKGGFIENASYTSSSNLSANTLEENRLRNDISELRKKIHVISSLCSVARGKDEKSTLDSKVSIIEQVQQEGKN